MNFTLETRAGLAKIDPACKDNEAVGELLKSRVQWTLFLAAAMEPERNAAVSGGSSGRRLLG